MGCMFDECPDHFPVEGGGGGEGTSHWAHSDGITQIASHGVTGRNIGGGQGAGRPRG